MDLNTITVAQFKARFYRDFTFGSLPAEALPILADPDIIQDQDITNAFTDAQYLLNQTLFLDNAGITLAYLYLTAHCLCNNINAANAGLGATANQPVNARSVGSVSESYTIPQEYLDDTTLAVYTSTTYGLKYLAMALPALRGNVGAVHGGTNP